jgi:hypothetical protein
MSGWSIGIPINAGKGVEDPDRDEDRYAYAYETRPDMPVEKGHPVIYRPGAGQI